MIFLTILGAVLLILLGLLFIPVKVDLKFTHDLKLKVSFLGITLFKSGKEKTQKKSPETESAKKKDKPKNLFAELKEKHGFVGSIKKLMSLGTDMLSHIKKLLRHIKIDKACLNITVGSFDAAKTALDYGLVCQAVYPVTAILDSTSNIDFKEINVRSDFENGKCDFSFSLAVKMQIFFLCATAIKCYMVYKKFVTENMENERKQ